MREEGSTKQHQQHSNRGSNTTSNHKLWKAAGRQKTPWNLYLAPTPWHPRRYTRLGQWINYEKPDAFGGNQKSVESGEKDRKCPSRVEVLPLPHIPSSGINLPQSCCQPTWHLWELEKGTLSGHTQPRGHRAKHLCAKKNILSLNRYNSIPGHVYWRSKCKLVFRPPVALSTEHLCAVHKVHDCHSRVPQGSKSLLGVAISIFHLGGR